MRSSYAWPSLLLLAVAACRVAESEDGSLDLFTRPLFYSGAETFASGSHALQGSRACIEIDSVFLEGQDGALDEWWGTNVFDECYGITLDGAPIRNGECVTLDGLGEALYEYTPLASCPFEEVAPRLVPDRYRLQVVALGDVERGSLEWTNERSAEIWLHSGARAGFPSDWIPPVDEPLQLVPGVEVPFPVVLLDATGERVAWDLEQGQVLESRDGGVPRALASFPDYEAYFPVSVGDGERSTLSLALPGGELSVAEVVATPVDVAASLEIVVGYWPHEDPEQWTAPVGARAVVRDAMGQVVFGTPVEWSLIEGHLVLGPLDEGLGTPPEYLALGDECEPPPGAPEVRRAVLQARLGGLVDELELEWTAMPDEEPSEEPFAPNPACQRGGEDDGLGDRGCGCTARPESRDAGGLAWGLVLLGAARLRRHGVRRSHRRT